ncbi:conjugal transfer protein (plasmid) [Xylella fastidiosa 9a5c]|uniref:Putative conjugal transfer lipoprotein XF_a0011.1 n=1 Tax=Xylella fastidiosa (strain 9a5c) TaxID=160492 RepID=YY1A_XYLFA|nr:RecName: Full=Putative conjugal transfer lipoprotein XF_a0011.1; Flags: Precursor [Xylella fastidiosa 9a5c]AAK97741.1 conjugal transfer protein [Xylella fastidiosa 9a5c]
MRYTFGIVTVYLLAGCAGSPPKPPEVKGKYRPINRVEAPASAGRNPVNSLNALCGNLNEKQCR